MDTTTASDPFKTLGVSPDASEDEVRARYLELVKQFPPERDSGKFREIRAAFEAAKDPLAIAQRLLQPPGEDLPQWQAVIEQQKLDPPAMTTEFLLSLGNRNSSHETRKENS